MTAIFMYKSLDSDNPNLFTSFYLKNKDVHVYNTRKSEDLHVPFGRTHVRKFSARINGSMIWNSLDETIRNSKNINLFKKYLKKHLIDKKVNS